ncbi:MAG: hypothetical protein LBB26_04545 [Puniceicoccales bacterium]|jgi:hypothetical protein|nr:hypothetical protein [Puniceicoccales bacterium]
MRVAEPQIDGRFAMVKLESLADEDFFKLHAWAAVESLEVLQKSKTLS